MAATVHHVTPRAVDRTATARDILNEQIVITNPHPYNLHVYATLNELVVNEQGDILDYVPNVIADRTNTITSWIEVTQGVIILPPGGSTSVAVRIAVPADAAPGEYHTLIGFGSGKNRPIATEKVINGSAPGTIIRLEVPEVVIAQSDIDRFSVDKFVVKRSQDAISYTIENTTAKPVAPNGEVIIYNNRGSEISTVEINQAGVLVQPGNTLAFEASIEDLQITGRYQAKLTLRNKNLAAAVYDASTFYYLPWWQILLALLLLLLFGSALYRKLHHAKYKSHGIVSLDNDVLPLHVYEGESAAADHDINLKQ